MIKNLRPPSYAILICSCAKNEFLAFHTLYCLSLIPILWQNAKQICILSPLKSENPVPVNCFILNKKEVMLLRPYDDGVEKCIQDVIPLLDADYVFFNMDDRPALRYSMRLLVELFLLLLNVSPDCVRITRDGPLSLTTSSFGSISKATFYKTSLTNTFLKKSFIQRLFISGASIWSIDKYGTDFDYTAYAPSFLSYLHPPISVSHLLLKGKIIELPINPLLRLAITKNFLKQNFFHRLYAFIYRILSPLLLSIL